MEVITWIIFFVLFAAAIFIFLNIVDQADEHLKSLLPTVEELRSLIMDRKKRFELTVVIALLISLIYIPSEHCVGNTCRPREWEFIFQMTHQVDFSRLLLQEVILGVIFYFLWRNIYRE